MKDFLYLDTAYLQSFIAQINNGLVLNAQTEKMAIQGIEKGSATQTSNKEYSVEVGIPDLIKYSRGKNIGEISESFFEKNWEVGKEIISKSLHDNIFEVFLNYTSDNKILLPKPVVGKYIRMKDDFTFFDLEYYKTLFSTHGGTEILFGDRTQEIIHLLPVFEFVTKMLPTSTFVTVANLLAPLKTEFLRETPKEIQFKYRGEITIVGKITSHTNRLNVSTKDSPTTARDMANIMDSALYRIMEQLGFIHSNSYILSPIAMYFS